MPEDIFTYAKNQKGQNLKSAAAMSRIQKMYARGHLCLCQESKRSASGGNCGYVKTENDPCRRAALCR